MLYMYMDPTALVSCPVRKFEESGFSVSARDYH